MPKRKRTEGQTTMYKTLYRKLNIEQHETHYTILQLLLGNVQTFVYGITYEHVHLKDNT
jgi:hypothetical protein